MASAVAEFDLFFTEYAHVRCRDTMGTAKLVMGPQSTASPLLSSTLTAGGNLSRPATTTPAESELEASCGVGV